MMRRGDIGIVAFPYVTGGGGKNRPALVVQCDRDNHILHILPTISAIGTIGQRIRSRGREAA